MDKRLLGVLVACVCSAAVTRAADSKAEAIADEVIKASGGANWSKVKRIDFTFKVEEGGKQLISAKHEWDLVKQTDRVTWGGKTVEVKLDKPGTDEDSKAAFQRWTNDAYWLLAPLKLRDPGTNVTLVNPPPAGSEQFDVINLSFGTVGLTPKDSYNLYIDRTTKLLARWDYMPAPDKKVSGTWDAYKEFGGLKLSTEHDFGGKRITFTEVKVESR
jgi:hypothetical protein